MNEEQKNKNTIQMLYYVIKTYDTGLSKEDIDSLDIIQQENTILKQQLKDKDEKISKIDTKLKKIKQKYNVMALTTNGEVYDLAQNIHEDILEILESNKEEK